MNFSKEFDEVLRLIQQKNSILLAVHEHPDGDALGSMLAMFSILLSLGRKKLVMFSKDPIPEYLKFMLHAGEITHDNPTYFFNGTSPDIFLGFDYGDFARLGVDSRTVNSSLIITFDHHPKAKQRGDILIIDDSASSTCEIIYDFFVYKRLRISSSTATALLTGIFTDTGGFAHINTSIKALRAAGDLMRYGASIPNVHKYIFCSKSPEAIKAWGHALGAVARDPKIGMAYTGIAYDEFMSLGGCVDDFEGVANIINLPPDVKFSLFLVECNPSFIKGSLRSESFKKVDVSKIARELGGGGHKYAAGFERTGETLEDVVKLVKQAAIEAI